jgi:excisionase family DNA binding protein
MDEILTVQEVADYLKVSRTTVWRWCNEGKLSAFKVGRGWRIHRLELEKMVGYHPGDEEANRGHGGTKAKEPL